MTETATEHEPPDAEHRARWPVVLVSMPFMDVGWPSIQLGLLSAILRQHRCPVRTLHANLDFAARIGIDHYRLLAERKACMANDWLFSVAAFGQDAPDPDARLLADYAEDLAYLDDGMPDWRERLPRIRRVDVPAYLDALAADLKYAKTRLRAGTWHFEDPDHGARSRGSHST